MSEQQYKDALTEHYNDRMSGRVASTIRAAFNAGWVAAIKLSPQPPTREQIAEAIAGNIVGTGYYSTQVGYSDALPMADAVLALLQKGGDQ